MYLKQLIVQGFKSFADRTIFTFDRAGMTCIVGPNGCGKSNVFEAVKWVLGEQRPTSLRSKELTDVIFNGTVRRPPMGLSEGVLVFDNSCGTLPTPEPEVRVTRRVFRSGDSDYQINGRACRLKDVRDLFAGTGLGAGGYAFMEQGKIDSILASNPVERRKVFEEAAGISRFRARKRETELKLERVEENLTRLHDIVEEIERQIRSLKLHAGKARSHREMTARVRELQLRFSVHRFRMLSMEQQALGEELQTYDDEHKTAAKVHSEKKDELKRIDQELRVLLDGTSALRTRYAEILERIKGLGDRIEFQSRYAREVDERREQREKEIATLKERIEDLAGERSTTARLEADLAHELESIQGVLSEHNSAAASAKEHAAALDRSKGEALRYLKDLERRDGDLLRELTRVEASMSHATERTESLARRREAAVAEREDVRARVQEETRGQGARHEALEAQRQELRAEEQRGEGLEKQIQSTAEALRHKELELGRLTARREVLGNLLAKGEGLDSGVRALLKERHQNKALLPGYRGLLHELMQVDLKRAAELQLALGDLAGAMVVETTAEIFEAIEWLKAKKAGRAVFLALDRFRATGTLEGSPITGCAAGIEALLATLLRGVEVQNVEAFKQSLLEERALPPLVVCEDGSFLRDGTVLHAPLGGDRKQGLVVITAEVNELDRRLPLVEQEDQAIRGELKGFQVERDKGRDRLRLLRAELLKNEGEAARLDQVVVRMMKDAERLNGELDRLAEEARGVEAQKSQLLAARATASDSREALASDRDGAEERLRILDAEVEAAIGAREEAAQALEKARIALAQTSERRMAATARLRQLDAAHKDAQHRLESSERDIADWIKAQGEAIHVVEDAKRELAALRAESEGHAEQLKRKEQESDEVRETLRGTADEVSQLEDVLERLRDHLSRSRGREGELRAATESLLSRAKEELQLDLSDQEQIKEFVEEEPEAVDWKAMEAEIKDLKERIIRLGNVNLAAVEELEAAEARASFILRERDDLVESRDQLKKVLKSIEEQSTGLFAKTFESVSEHFSNIFRRLFGGGKAEIFLENPENPLESGIEIKARPPGKEFRSITLLSGGERTMTAVALLFAIFRANPAPCAFLDEVDAALDEDNTDRFCRMLMEFNDQSQFVVVSHSKRTMERADLLYGVTMPERGVSRRVAVRLEQLDEEGRFRDIESVNRAAAVAEQNPEDAQEMASNATESEDADRGSSSERAGARTMEAPVLTHRVPRARKVAEEPPTGPSEAEAGA
jgi:chromosome segregation protein